MILPKPLSRRLRRIASALDLAFLLTVAGAGVCLIGVMAMRAPQERPAFSPPQLEPGATFTEFGPVPELPEAPRDLVRLGERLFEEPLLSGSGQIACSSCHNRELGFADGLSRSLGHDRRRLTRNAPSLLTSAWMNELFWDGRARSLEDQAPMPILHPDEMRGDLATVRQRLAASADYRQAFTLAFGDAAVTDARIASALAAFQRSLNPRRGRWARYLAGDADALNEQQKRGLALFRGKGGCASCHNGPLLSDQRYHNLGISLYGSSRQDLGRYAITGRPEDVGAFRTPSLLGVSRSAPYMHHGGLPTLTAVVTFYNAGGAHPRRLERQAGDPLFPTTSPLLRPRQMTREEQADLVAFLEAL